jgi:hypothetical protein
LGYYKKNSVVIIPAQYRDAFNAVLERQGYGPNNLHEPVFGEAETKGDAKPTHYVMDCKVDDGFLAAITLASQVVKEEEGVKPAVVESQYAFEKVTEAKPFLSKDTVLTKEKLQTRTKLDIAVAKAEPIEEPKEEPVGPTEEPIGR